VRRVSVAFDWTARPTLQAALERIAGRHDLSTARGMHAAATEVIALLGQHHRGVRFGMWQRFRTSPEGAERLFQQTGADLKARYRHDVVKHGALSARRYSAEEGPGLIVVTLIFGATTPMPPLPHVFAPTSWLGALRDAVRLSPEELVAFEVVWSPAEETDRMSSHELRTIYPELLPIGGKMLGSVSCTYCRAVYARELDSCPACGAGRAST